ncbi:cytochrome d ubiquinol oxidase subunit II [Polaromonas naphthalenivorans]|uniref:Cytochrome bd quinol oxidase subunit 2 apoprotein n=1 Tax=Polaromonas naphthalenivorans (strain CJ2) TaxID=365044 RepID=A1VJI8_POLNA|nr:cytochrome d ubiquinol oxidase subunit II [Polaromonas naphthalenivorans]ABM35816.1 cytochrome bd quinol oxidase subunit 2 apoprotein [Polaromonas naphthalenivorans CJ2]
MLDMAPNLTQAAGWMPIVFLGVMGLAMLAYVILDGYDLGVGMLMRRASEDDKDSMIASIGPFWDANETWLVLGVGILLTVFPMAHGVILGALYLPVAMMLIGLTLRGVAFDFRVKAHAARKPLWNRAFYAGSLMASWSQGYMLGSLITGFATTGWVIAFNAVIGLALLSAYCLLGAGWLIIKSGGALQLQAVRWARASLWLTMAGIAAISLATPWVSPAIFDKWFSFPNIVLLLPIPVATAVLFWVIYRSLQRLPTRLAQGNEYGIWVPFGATIGVFLLAFYGLAYSLFPWLVIDRINIWQAAISPESMGVILAGAVVVLPMIIGYTVFSYRVFWGKSGALKY